MKYETLELGYKKPKYETITLYKIGNIQYYEIDKKQGGE